MTQQVRELLRDALGKQAFDALSMEERKRMTGIMRDLVAQAGLDRIREAVKQNKGKIQPSALASANAKQDAALSAGSIAVLMPLIAAMQTSDQSSQRPDQRAGTPETVSAGAHDHDLASPFPDPMVAPAAPKPAWAR